MEELKIQPGTVNTIRLFDSFIKKLP